MGLSDGSGWLWRFNKAVWNSKSVRIGKQCRERWLNHLNPDINKTPFSTEEDILIIEQQKLQGNRWACIANMLHGRTENSVKNRFKQILKKFCDTKYGKSFFPKYLKEK